MKVLGLDLSAKEINPTGLCILTEEGHQAKIYYYDKDILEEIQKSMPDVVAIDSPLSFPSRGLFRHSDVLLQKMGYHPLSPNFEHMKQLVIRTRKLMKRFPPRARVIEAFPQATAKILGLEKNKWQSEHEFDAYLCSLTAKYYLEGKYEAIGRQKIILPNSNETVSL